jgi:hypothetical protein
MNLIDDVMGKFLFNLKNRRPENGARAIRLGRPEGGVVKIFGLDNAGEKRIFNSGNIPGIMSDKTFVDNVKVFDSNTHILFGLIDILPGTEGNRIGGVIFLNAYPPKSTDDSSDLLHKSFGEKNSRHVVDRNRDKDRFDVSKTASVIQFVSPNSGKFGIKFIDNEIISFVLVPVAENDGVTEMHGIRK